MIQIPISDLVYINEAGKALKCRDFMWKQDKIISMDSMDYIVYGRINTSKLSVFPSRGIIFNQRELSKIMKSITTESYFNVSDEFNNSDTLLSTVSDNMFVRVNHSADIEIDNKLAITHEIDTLIGENDVDVSSKLSALYNLNKSSGIIQFQYDDSHMMTLFAGILPLSKSDKILLGLYDYPNSSIFCTRFTVAKKIFRVHIYLKYIKI